MSRIIPIAITLVFFAAVAIIPAQTTEGLLIAGGHAGPITAIAFTPDGDHLLTTSMDRTIRVWDAETRRPVRPPAVTDYAIDRMSVSDDGSRFFATDRFGNLYQSDLDGIDAKPYFVSWDDRQIPIRALAYHRDGAVYMAGEAGLFRMDPPAVRAPEHPGIADVTPIDPGVWLHRLRLSPDGRFAVTNSPGGEIASVRIYDLESGTFTDHQLASPSEDQSLSELSEEFASTMSVVARVSGDANAILAVASGGLVRIDRRGSGTTEWIFRKMESDVYRGAFSPDGRWAALGSFDGSVIIVDVETGSTQVHEIENDSATALAFSPDSNRIVAGTWKGALLEMTPGVPGHLRVFTPAVARVVGISQGRDAGTLAIGTRETSLRLWDLGVGTLLGDPIRTQGEVTAFGRGRDGEVVIGYESGGVTVIDTYTNDVVATWPGEEPIEALALSSDARVAAGIVRQDRMTSSVRVWRDLEGPWQPRNSDINPFSIAVTAGGDFVIHGERELYVHQIGDGTPVRIVRVPHPDGTTEERWGKVTAIIPDHERNMLIVADTLGRIMTWPLDKALGTTDSENSRLYEHYAAPALGRRHISQAIDAHDTSVDVMAIDSKGTLVTAGSQGNVHVWNRSSDGQLRQAGTTIDARGSVRSLALPGEGSVAIAGYDGSVRIIDLLTGQLLMTILTAVDGRSLSWTPGGRFRGDRSLAAELFHTVSGENAEPLSPSTLDGYERKTR